MGEIPFEGTLKVGHNVQIGYFAQNQAQLLDGDTTVFDTIDRVATGDMRTKVRDILGAFLFRGDDIDKFVKVLSGGERSRLAMIRLLLQPVNFLILDEPTNHLDMQSKEVLKQAVKDFDGTVIVVSHDRDFLDGLIERVYEFGGGKVREHIGGIYDFLEKKRLENEGMTGLDNDVNARIAKAKEKNTGKSEKEEKQVSDTPAALSYAEQKEMAKQRRKLEKHVADVEQQIEKVETQIADIEAKMITPEGAADSSLFTNHAYLKAQLSDLEDEWEQASTELENFQADNH
jgi:ATP-binding cassette subfamily F protein 3